MNSINNKVYDGLNGLLVSLEQLIDYKDYILIELSIADSYINNDEEKTAEELRVAEVSVNYYSNELKKVDDKLNEVILGVNLLKGKIDLFKSQRADIIDKSVDSFKTRR